MEWPARPIKEKGKPAWWTESNAVRYWDDDHLGLPYLILAAFTDFDRYIKHICHMADSKTPARWNPGRLQSIIPPRAVRPAVGFQAQMGHKKRLV